MTAGDPGLPEGHGSIDVAASFVTQALPRRARPGADDEAPAKKRARLAEGARAGTEDQENLDKVGSTQEAAAPHCQDGQQHGQQRAHGHQHHHHHGGGDGAGGAKAGLTSTLFSPIYQLVQQAHAGGMHFVKTVAAGLTPVRGPAAAPPDALPQPLLLGASAAALTAEQQEAALVSKEPPLEDEEEAQPGQRAEETDEEEDDDAFDTYLFISRLPPLHECGGPEPNMALLPRQTRACKRKTLVLDLDETLVHSTLGDWPPAGEAAAGGGPPPMPDFSFPVSYAGREHMVHVRRRPHVDAFLEAAAARFEVVVFTASQKLYAERLLNLLDPGRRLIRHRVYRDACVVVAGNYLKDLSRLGRDLAHTLIVDNSPQAFGFQLDNGVPITSWYDDGADCELLHLLPFLDQLAEVEDVRPHIASRYRLRDMVAAVARKAGDEPPCPSPPGSSSGAAATQQALHVVALVAAPGGEAGDEAVASSVLTAVGVAQRIVVVQQA